MSTQPTSDLNSAARIPSNYSRLIARELKLQQRDLPSLLQGTQVTTAEFLNEDNTLSAAQQAQILSNALALSGDPAFGLRLGRRLTPATHGALGVLAHSSPNLRLALEAVCIYVPTRMPIIELELRSDEQTLTLLCSFKYDLEPDIRRCLADTLVAIYFEFAEFIIGRPLQEARVCFLHAEPDNCSYAEYLPGELLFAAEQFSMSMPLAVAEIPNASASRESYELALNQCQTMLAELPDNRQSYTYKVQKLMLSQPLGLPTETETAAALFMTKRTLARRLKAEDTGFRQIRDYILAQQASSYLRDSQLSVEAIAGLLRYHDAASFRRAFKRWFQMSPNQYRQSV